MTTKFGMTAQEAIKLIEDCGLNIEQPLHDIVANCIVTVLERQIQKKPISKPMNGFDYEVVACPNCGHSVINYWNKNINPPHCMMCGQALDWSGENDTT